MADMDVEPTPTKRHTAGVGISPAISPPEGPDAIALADRLSIDGGDRQVALELLALQSIHPQDPVDRDTEYTLTDLMANDVAGLVL